MQFAVWTILLLPNIGKIKLNEMLRHGNKSLLLKLLVKQKKPKRK